MKSTPLLPSQERRAQVAVLVIGRGDDSVLPAGLENIVELVGADGGSPLVECAKDLNAAIALFSAGRNFDLIVLVESRPGASSAASIDALRRLAPLTRFWRLLGSWCEGEERSGRPPSGCATSYWHQWPVRAAREFTTARAGRCPGWGLPLTATADERVLFAAEAPLELGSGLIVVCAARSAQAAAAADACRLGGYEALIVAEGSHFSASCAKAVLWDTRVEDACDASLVRELRRAAGDAPLLALVGFPRPDDVRRASQAGATAIISKPYLVRDLLWHLAEAIRLDARLPGTQTR